MIKAIRTLKRKLTQEYANNGKAIVVPFWGHQMKDYVALQKILKGL